MIYDIYVETDDADYRDVRLDMAIEDYQSDTYSVTLTLDRVFATRGLDDVMYAASGQHFVPLTKGQVPEWVKRLIITLTPRMHDVMDDPNSVPITRWLEEAA